MSSSSKSFENSPLNTDTSDSFVYRETNQREKRAGELKFRPSDESADSKHTCGDEVVYSLGFIMIISAEI